MSSEKLDLKDYFFFICGDSIELDRINDYLSAPAKEAKLFRSKDKRLSQMLPHLQRDLTAVFINVEIDQPGLLDALEKPYLIFNYGKIFNGKTCIEQLSNFIGEEIFDKDFLAIIKGSITEEDSIDALGEKYFSKEELREVLKDNRYRIGNTSLIESHTVDLSAVYIEDHKENKKRKTDATNQENLIIYSQSELRYYGQKNNIKSILKWFYKQSFYQQFDLFSLGEKALLIQTRSTSKKEIKDLCLALTDLLNKLESIHFLDTKEREGKEIYSYHIFAFPFQLGNNFPFEEKQQQETLLEIQKKLVDQPQWESSDFKIESILDYNEQNYFHDYIWDSIYQRNSENQHTLKYFEYKFDDNNAAKKDENRLYKINVETKGDNSIKKDYTLHIEKITLQLYTTGVGILNFFLQNKEDQQSSPNDILRINQFGRRLYPPFYSTDKAFDAASTDDNFAGGRKGGNQKGVQETTLPSSISILDKSNNFDQYTTDNQPPDTHKLHILPSIITQFFYDIEELRKATPVLDDRMFVLSWYGNNNLANYYSMHRDIWKTDDFWFQYTFVDNANEKTCPNPEMAQSIVGNATNPRWSPYGTLYGVTDYSFVILSADYESLKKNDVYFLPNHLRTMYHKMVELCILQRASLLNFSAQLKHQSLIDNPQTQEQKHIRIRKILKSYTQFINQHYFREVTPQTQGIELYQQLQEAFSIEREVEHLDKEIKNYYDLLSLEAEERKNTASDKMNFILACITAFLIVPSFFLGFYGMNTFDNKLSAYNIDHLWIILLGVIVAGFASFKLLINYVNANKKRVSYAPLWWLLLFGSLLALLWVGFCNPIQKDPIQKATFKNSITNDTIQTEIIIPSKKVKVGKQSINIPADTIQVNQVLPAISTDSIIIAPLKQ